jgi:hypothetical protein
MTKLEAIAFFMDMDECTYGSSEPIQMAIEALKQEPCEDEIILTKEEYGQLLSNEFDNGYAKGYREALEQDSILGKIRAEIEDLTYYCCEVHPRTVIDDVLDIIDKYKAGE